MATLTVRHLDDGAELVAALRRLGELGVEIEPDRRSEPPRVGF